MKIGFYGNANNYPFMLALALRRMGHEILFIVSSPERLNRPEFRYGDFAGAYPPWIRDLSSGFRWRFLVPGGGRRIRTLLATCDLVVLNEEGPALAADLGRPSVVLLTGSNLEIFADPAKASTLKPQLFSRPRWLQSVCRALFPAAIIRRWLTTPQRAGIRQARLVAYFARGLIPSGDRLLDEIGVPGDRRIFLLMADLEINPCTPPPQNPVVRIFCLARLTWKAEPGSDLVSLDYKGTDRMIRGLALFWKKHGVKLEVRLARKGRHVAETRQLVDELGLADQVTWLAELTQSEVREEYRAADIVFDQLADSVVGMGGLEAMATGRPLIANAHPEIIDPVIGEPSPVCQARTAEEVLAQLERLVLSPAERSRVGLAGRTYVERHFSAAAAAHTCLQRLVHPPPATAFPEGARSAP
ncbi:MAG TPA: glycosyltransferase family 4 protein [Opitutaceae bacterium]|nr:glycosyltransferase family 4 protein [Opitutaceae bacterium]